MNDQDFDYEIEFEEMDEDEWAELDGPVLEIEIDEPFEYEDIY